MRRVAKSPGAIGQGNLISTSGALVSAALGGPALTVAIGSLFFLTSPDWSYGAAFDPGLALRMLREGHACCAMEILSQPTAAFIKENWLALMIWSAAVGVASSAVALNTVFAVFRDANWPPVLNAHIGGHIVFAAVSFPYLEVMALLAGSMAGVTLAWAQYGLLYGKSAYCAPPADLSLQAPAAGSWPRPAGRRLPPAEFEFQVDQNMRHMRNQIGGYGGVFFAAAIASYLFMGELIGQAMAIFWSMYAVKYALIYVNGRFLDRESGIELTVDERGLHFRDEGQIRWEEIGRTWIGGQSGNALALEVPEQVERRVRDSWSWINRLHNLGDAAFKRRHIGLSSLVIESEFLDATAEALQDAVEARRPRGSQWRPGGTLA